MAIFDKIFDFVSGGMGGKIVDAVSSHFPPNMSEAEREQVKMAIAQATRDYELQLLQLGQKEAEAFNNRIKDMEGTASDLNAAGLLGRIILFMRGAQRPIWGFAVLYLDFMVFSGNWKVAGSSVSISDNGMASFDLQSAFWMINFLVLGFLFGERAMRNVMPFFQARMGGGGAPANGGGNRREQAAG